MSNTSDGFSRYIHLWTQMTILDVSYSNIFRSWIFTTWITELQSVPMHVLEDYNLSSLTLEYRRECRQSNMLDSLTSMKTLSSNQNNSDTLQTNSSTSENNGTSEKLKCTHLLRMETDHAEIVRARSTWQPKQHPSM